jgi:DNA replication and repair protein RecF
VCGFAVSALALSHFRSHRATRLFLDGRPVTIVGPNGAGKTSILEAVSLLSPGRGLRRAAAADLPRRPESLGWKISAQVFGIGGSHEVETWAEADEARQTRIDGKASTQTALGRVLRILWLVPAMDRLWIESAEGRRRFLDRITLSFAPDHAEATLAYERAMRDRNRLLKDQVTDPHWYTALETRMEEAAGQITRNRQRALQRIAMVQSASDSVFPTADLSLVYPEENPVDLAAALAAGRRRDMAAGRTLAGPHRADLVARYSAKGIVADQCSTGEQKALLINLILSNARAVAEDIGQSPILLLDEIAAHLDADRRAALYDEICRLKSQTFMTGTEATLFDTLGNRAQNLTVADEGDASIVRP